MRTKMFVVLIVIATAGATWAFAQRTGSNGALTTQDYIDIQQLYAAYNHSVDSGNFERLASIFTPGGGLNNGTVESLVESVKGQIARTKGGGRHWTGNLLITPTPDGAKGSCYMFVLETASKPPNVTPTGIYDDTLVKTATGWRFNRRTLRTDAARTQ